MKNEIVIVAVGILLTIVMMLGFNFVKASERTSRDYAMRLRALEQRDLVLRAQIYCLTEPGQATSERVRNILKKVLPTASIAEELCIFDILRQDGVSINLLLVSDNEARAHVHNSQESKGGMDFASVQIQYTYISENSLGSLADMQNPYP